MTSFLQWDFTHNKWVFVEDSVKEELAERDWTLDCEEREISKAKRQKRTRIVSRRALDSDDEEM